MTSTSKRSQLINLARMRKYFAPRPIALSVAAIMLTACGDQQEATIYTNEADCADANPGHEAECKAAFEQAVADAERTAPKYNSMSDCEYEFGYDRCRAVNNSSGSFFMPFMAGYMLSNLLSPGPYYSQPMFTSYSRYSPYRNQWITTDGRSYGNLSNRHYRVDKDVFKPKPTVNRTMKRGGFGSSVRAKSSWGSSSRGGWGG